SARLAKQFAKPGTETAAAPPTAAATATAAPASTASAPVKPGRLPGNWTARPASDTTIRLNVADDGSFTWTVDSRGKSHKLAGKWTLGGDVLTFAQSGEGGALVGRVEWQADNRWTFREVSAGAGDPGLTFTR